MIENLTRPEYETLLRQDFRTFVARCLYDLNPQTELAINWHLEVIAAKLTAVREGKIQRLIINLPPPGGASACPAMHGQARHCTAAVVLLKSSRPWGL